MKAFVDTNIFLRFLLADHPTQSPASKKLFEKAKNGKLQLVTIPMVLAEVVWVLESFYEESRKEIVRKLHIIILFEGLEINERNILLKAINTYGKANIDFIDAYVSAWMGNTKMEQIYSYEKDFEKLTSVKRLSP